MKNIKGKIAITEILLLVVAVFAIAWMVQIDSGVGIVSAAPGDEPHIGTVCWEGGTCIDTTTTTCSGEIVDDLCPGSEDIKCCIIETEDPEPEDNSDGGSNVGEGIIGLGKYGFSMYVTQSIPKWMKKVKDFWKGVKLGGGTDPNFIGPPEFDYSSLTETSKAAQTSGFKEVWSHFLRGGGGPVESIAMNAALAVGVALLITNLANRYSSQRNAGDISIVAWTSAGIGIAGTSILGIIGLSAFGGGGPPGWVAGAVTLLAVGVYMLVGYQLYSQQVFSYQASLWQPPTGGNDCERCNDLEINDESVCSEYICHTYGTTCEWINDETEYESCVEIPQDRVAPRINPLSEAYDEPVFDPPEEYEYSISSAGARIVYHGNNGCVPAFTPITIAFETDERAHCRIDIVPHDSEDLSDEEIFNNMMDLAEGSVYGHTHTIELPSAVSASENALQAAGYGISNGGIHEFYIRCLDLGGTYNDHDYSMGFCVHTGPDLSPPEITGTNPEEGSYIAYGIESLENFIVFTNKPATCRWGFQPAAFESMPYAFDRCSMNINDPILNGGYEFGCTGEITGINPGEENSFYVVCIDQPELAGTPREHERNVGDPYEIIFMGSQPLIIDAVAVNEQENNSIVSDNTENVDVLLEVVTSDGAENGNSRCRYSRDVQEPRNYNPFYNEGSFDYVSINSQPLYLSPGNYKYNIECEDIAGNIATTMINFSIETDLDPPQVVRVYKEGNNLVVITDEQADCVYDLFTCNYGIEEGNLIDSGDGIIHILEWDSGNDFYIKCMDASGITPLPNECSLIARPFEIHDLQDFE